MRQESFANLDPSPDSNRSAEPVEIESPEKLGVLVIDDDHQVRLMVQLGLERNGFDVWSASNGREAIELYRRVRNRIAVVLLDVRMPDMDGPATLDALHALNPDVPAFFMSGDSGKYEPEDLFQHGAAGLIAKPFQLDQLVGLLRSISNGGPGDSIP